MPYGQKPRPFRVTGGAPGEFDVRVSRGFNFPGCVLTWLWPNIGNNKAHDEGSNFGRRNKNYERIKRFQNIDTRGPNSRFPFLLNLIFAY